MSVEKAFWRDPYQSRLETRIAGVSGNDVTLAATIFYAFSGGQESDSGTIGGRRVLDARKGEIYGAAFRWDEGVLCGVEEARAAAPIAFARGLELPCTLLGDGVDAYEHVWREALGEKVALISAASLPASGAATAWLGESLYAQRGADDPETLEPAYLRPSEAEIKRGNDASSLERAKN